jgi:hypothetical protein
LDVSTTKTFQFTATAQCIRSAKVPACCRLADVFVKSFTRVYDFTTGTMRDEVVRMAAQTPTLGPEEQTVTLVSGDYAWNEVGKDRLPRSWEVNERQHYIWTSPHGVVRAAFANNATITKQNIEGRQMTVVSFVEKGKQKVNVYANDQNQIERESWYASCGRRLER